MQRIWRRARALFPYHMCFSVVEVALLYTGNTGYLQYLPCGVFLRVSGSENKCPSCHFSHKACINKVFIAILLLWCQKRLIPSGGETEGVFLPISEIQVTCNLTSACLVVAAVQHALVSTSGCCAAWVWSSSGARGELTGLVCSTDRGRGCELGVMHVYVVLQIAKKCVETRAWPGGAFLLQSSIAEGHCSSWAAAFAHSFTL